MFCYADCKSSNVESAKVNLSVTLKKILFSFWSRMNQCHWFIFTAFCSSSEFVDANSKEICVSFTFRMTSVI